MSRQRRANQASNAMTDQDALKRAAEIKEELDARSKRCMERIAEIIKDENCELVVRGQFAGNEIQSELMAVAKPKAE